MNPSELDSLKRAAALAWEVHESGTEAFSDATVTGPSFAAFRHRQRMLCKLAMMLDGMAERAEQRARAGGQSAGSAQAPR